MVTAILDNKNKIIESFGVAIVSRNPLLLKQLVEEIASQSKAEIKVIWDKLENDLTDDEIKWFYEQLGDAVPRVIEPLNDEERIQKQLIESRLYDFFCSFVDRGRDLYTLKIAKLYREEYTSWSQYCKFHLGIHRTQVDRLIKAFFIVEELKPFGFKLLPPTEAVARELGKIKGAKERADIWERAIAINEDSHKTITSDVIKRIKLESLEVTVYVPLELQIGELIVVNCKDSSYHNYWGRIFNTTNNGRYKVQIGLSLITLKSDEVIVPEVIDDDFCERVESIINGKSDQQIKSIVTTFYSVHKPLDWQLKLLKCLEEICQ